MNYLSIIILILLSPFLAGVISKVKAKYAGKKGPSFLYPYFLIIKLFNKSIIYSNVTSSVFKLSPIINFIIYFIALFFIPFYGNNSIFSFNYDFIFLFYLFALGRFFMVIAALDTGSSFQGMGASREVFFSILAESTIFMILIYFVKLSSKLSFSNFFTIDFWNTSGLLNIIIIISLFIIMLTESSRVPVDDPSTHLELTMIHEVMVLDNSGSDMALIHLASDLKLLFYASLISKIISSAIKTPSIAFFVFCSSLFVIYILIGIIESSFARYKMNLVPKFILSSFALSTFAVAILVEYFNV
jgi:formate hydrogenlyase subunit 4